MFDLEEPTDDSAIRDTINTEKDAEDSEVINF